MRRSAGRRRPWMPVVEARDGLGSLVAVADLRPGMISGRWPGSAQRMNGFLEEVVGRSGVMSGHTAVDVGCGTGSLALGLAQRVRKVIGVDVSGYLLRIAAANAWRASLNNVEFMEGGVGALPLGAGAADAVFCNLLLHHAADPDAAIRDMCRVLRPGGVVVLADLELHDEVWAVREGRDLWPGFERTDVTRWLAGAGLAGVVVEPLDHVSLLKSRSGKRALARMFVAMGWK